MSQSAPDFIDPQALIDELFPLCRSLSGYGYDQSLDILKRYIPFHVEEYASGSKVFDWTVPPRWELDHAVLKDSHGRVIIDAAQNSLHVLNYSQSFKGRVSRAELESHLYSDPTRPQLIPYVISYYNDRWGFCLSHEQRQSLTDDCYEVDIAARKVAGPLKVGVCELSGQSERIVQLSSYLCHPSMLNNELSGPLALVYLYHLLRAQPERYYTYRFVINPETIGSLCYIAAHYEELTERLEYGVVLTCLGSFYKNAHGKDSISPLDLRDLNSLEALMRLYRPQDSQGCPQRAQYQKSQAAADATNGVPQPAALQQQFFKMQQQLLQQLQDSINPNFLPLPLSFQRTRQSVVDELHFVFAQQHQPQQQQLLQTPATPAFSRGAGKASSPDVLLAQKLTQQKEPALLEKWQQELQSSELSYNHGIYSKKRLLSDEERMALYLLKRHDYGTQHGISSAMLDQVLPLSQAYTFAYSRAIDQFLSQLAHSQGDSVSLHRFALMGSDERQYNSPRVNLPVVQVTRVQFDTYPEYHSSGDNQELFALDSILDAALKIWRLLQLYEQQQHKFICQVKGEPQLGKRGLYPDLHSDVGNKEQYERNVRALQQVLTVLSLSDGSFTFDELQQSAGCTPFELSSLLEKLQHHGLIK
ncbi:MAG: DUF4910 domain-containing protein [Candidatus Anaerobiospirillum pullicola]|uniref:DUF4910 domain-containing protein n=1 Tax=Candidatus Anaerobiospirillum pullicola TaxID=2838451 RepID=A0A948WZB7_9GAMM|nr:DUF4910 domain-containing protein [Candidatus Anaerobiospirillum pullicola]